MEVEKLVRTYPTQYAPKGCRIRFEKEELPPESLRFVIAFFIL